MGKDYPKLYLVLGCFGRKDDDFSTCNSVENIILEIKPNLEDIDRILYYLESLQLSKRPLMDYNAVRRALFYIQDNFYQNLKPIWSDKYFRILENFTILHKSCGIYLRLID